MRRFARTKLWALAGTAAVALCLAAPSAMAGKADDTLNIAWDVEVPNVNMYFDTSRNGVIIAHHVWDALVWRDPASGDFKPLLATSWNIVDDKTIELDIRQGVKFHNGDPMTADDVVYTYNYLARPDNGILNRSYTNWIDKAEKIGDNKVRITAKDTNPLTLLYMGEIGIYPQKYYEAVGPEGMGTKPVGTGPYKITEVDPGKRLVLEAFADYYDSPKGQPKIKKIVQRTIPEMNTQVVELASGRLNWIWRVAQDQADRLEKSGRVEIINANTMRVGYLHLNAVGGPEDSPLRKLKVRQAINHAVNLEGIVKNLVRGSSQVIYSACYPEQFGCTDDVQKYPYDPAKAKQLLAEAGYPNGFSTTFYAYRDRSQNEAIMSDLAAVGIKAELRYGQYAATRDALRKGEVPIASLTWGSNSIPDVDAILPVFFGGLPDDMSKDEEVRALLKEGKSTLDQDKRKAAYKKALQKIAAQAYWVPTWTYTTNYAISNDLDFKPTADEIPRFWTASWK